MPVFNDNIKKLAKANNDFRREILTNAHSQVVLLCLQPGEDIGEEIHAGNDQLLVLVKGKGEVRLEGIASAVEKGALISVPAGTRHNLVNTGDEPIHLYTVYSPPETAPGTVHATKAEAMAAEHAQDDATENRTHQGKPA
jgi:mannose-6-phosphate isomerase-like protein (cupin superfamily)